MGLGSLPAWGWSGLCSTAEGSWDLVGFGEAPQHYIPLALGVSLLPLPVLASTTDTPTARAVLDVHGPMSCLCCTRAGETWGQVPLGEPRNG